MEKSSHLKIKQLDFFVREMRALLTETKVCTTTWFIHENHNT